MQTRSVRAVRAALPVALCFGLALGAAPLLLAQPDAAPAGVARPAKARQPRVAGTAQLRVLHAIPGGPTVDVYLDGKKALNGLAYRFISEYIEVPSGSHTLALRTAGAEATVAPLATLKKTLAADGTFVAAAHAVGGAPAILVQNETTGKLGANKASVRFYHLSPDAPTVSITTPSTARLAKDGTRTVVKELAPGKSRVASLNAGAVPLSLRAEGKVVKEVTLTPEIGKRYAAFAIGKAAGPEGQALEVMVKTVGK